MINKKTSLILIIILLFTSLELVQAQTNFTRRNHFSLGQSVKTVKFSPDYTLLAVIRYGYNKLLSYNPMTFELIGETELQGAAPPTDVQMFGNDVIVAAQPNLLFVYQRKVNSAQMILKQKVILKSFGGIQGIRLEKLNEDLNGKSQATSTRHLVVWSIFSQSSFEVYKYAAAQDTNKITFLFDKIYQPPAPYLTDFEFFDEKFLVFGLKTSNTVGETYLIELSNTTKITKVDSKVTQSLKSFSIKPTGSFSASNFLLITHQKEVNQFKTKSKTIQQGANKVSSVGGGKAFSDNNKMIGFFNQTSLYIYKTSQVFYETYPKYTSRLQQSNKGESSITIVAMPQSNTGEFIANHCYQNGSCFYYYSVCGPNTYLTTNAVGTEICKKCTSDANCEKCLNDACVKCNIGFYFGPSKKCQLCNLAITGCTDCSQDGKTCRACDIKQFEKTPVNNTCQCIKGTVWQPTAKKCVYCQTKVTYCSACHTLQNTQYQCTECTNGLNRIPNVDGSSCICDSFYYENQSKQCSLCDAAKKCKKCTAYNNCQQCDTNKQWVLDQQGKCVCNAGYVEVNSECWLCDILGCETCSTDTKCKTCKPGFKLQKNQQCVCQDNRFLNHTSKQCEICSVYIDGCYQCSNNKTCQQCDDKMNRIEQPTPEGKCLCKSTYTENSHNQCMLCTTPGCLNCETENYCTSCNENSGFNTTVVGGKCKCQATKYLDNGSGSCKECSESILGCQSCNNASTCATCNQTANFDVTPVNGECKCIQNYFVSDSQCLQCQVICQHCQKCVLIVSEDMLQTSVGCAQCQDDFQVKDSRCVQNNGNSLVYIGVSIGVLTILIIVGVCCYKKKKQVRRKKKLAEDRENNTSLVSMLLKQSANDVITTDRTEIGSKSKHYQSQFSGNINYSISSAERESDKKSFNETLKEMQRERRMQQKKKKNQTNSYTDLGKNMKGSQKPLTDDQKTNLKKQNLFSHRGKDNQSRAQNSTKLI